MEEENKEVPLLEKVYYEDCPGCKIQKRKDTQPEIPWMILLHVWIMTLCVALPISSLFPFLYFMVRDFGVAKQEEDVGFYAGFIGSSYMFGRALTSVLWGKLADIYGRKPVIISGAIAVVVFNTIFGLSVNLRMAILSRFLLGIFCGMIGPVKLLMPREGTCCLRKKLELHYKRRDGFEGPHLYVEAELSITIKIKEEADEVEA